MSATRRHLVDGALRSPCRAYTSDETVILPIDLSPRRKREPQLRGLPLMYRQPEPFRPSLLFPSCELNQRPTHSLHEVERYMHWREQHARETEALLKSAPPEKVVTGQTRRIEPAFLAMTLAAALVAGLAVMMTW